MSEIGLKQPIGSFDEKIDHWVNHWDGKKEATSEFAVAEVERDNLQEELDAVKLEIKMLQDACDHPASEVNGLVLGWLWAAI